MTVNFRFILSTWHFTSTVQGSKWKKYSYSDIDIMTSRYQDIKISTSKQRRFQAGIFFSQNKKWTFHEIQYSLYDLYHLSNCPNLFQNFHVIETNSFSKAKKSFFWKKHKNLAVFPQICLKASIFIDNRQKSGKKTFLLFRSNIEIHDFVKIRWVFL